MKKRLVSAALILAMAMIFCSCGSTDTMKIYYDGDFDTSSFNANKSIDGLIFLIPSSIYKNKIKYSTEAAKEYTDPNKAAKVIFYAFDGKDYQIWQAGTFYEYILSYDSLSNIKSKYTSLDKINALVKDLGITLSADNSETFVSLQKDNATKITDNVIIKNSETNSSYEGYVSMLENGDTGKTYVLLIGYGETGNSAAAKTIAENFTLVK